MSAKIAFFYCHNVQSLVSLS